MTPLGQLVTVASGVHVTTKIEDEGTGVPLVQLRDLGAQHLDLDGAARIAEPEPMPRDHHRIRPGDVLFGARGVTRPAACVPDDVPDGAAATSQMFILRVTDDRLDPAFLAWYLNTETARAFFEAYERGAVVRFVPKSVLTELPVPLPPLDAQHALARAGRLARDAARLAHDAADRRAVLTEGLLLRAALAASQQSADASAASAAEAATDRLSSLLP